ncbi:hypothetical protein C1H46_001284 [Malus baccata]|uniref:Uncharacterized protein n=1 Tax=Malus baccata TaxID=106549 RepID=A0A540NRK5_MALBA|nr:hypothetical protein C1H46_001284 [Malus baccata]
MLTVKLLYYGDQTVWFSASVLICYIVHVSVTHEKLATSGVLIMLHCTSTTNLIAQGQALLDGLKAACKGIFLLGCGDGDSKVPVDALNGNSSTLSSYLLWKPKFRNLLATFKTFHSVISFVNLVLWWML